MYFTSFLQAFAGNSNTESVVRHDLQNPTVARYLRIIPLDWSEEGRIGLRFEIYGCPYCKLTLLCYISHQYHPIEQGLASKFGIEPKTNFTT